jgi:hypothetical protein
VSLAKLSDRDRQIILQCLNAILNGSFLESEFQTRIGIEPEELEQIITAYPNIDDSDDDSKEALTINNCLNEVCNGIGFSDLEWSKWFTVDKSEVEEVFGKWSVLRRWSSTGIR